MSSGIETIFGAALVGRGINEEEDVKEVLKVLESEGIKKIDTAQIYANSENLLGKVEAGKRFVLDTKCAGGFVPGASEKNTFIKEGKESLKRLGVDKVRCISSLPVPFIINE